MADSNEQEVGEPPFNYVAIMERVAPGESWPVLVSADPETVAAVTLLLEERLRRHQVHRPSTTPIRMHKQEDGRS